MGGRGVQMCQVYIEGESYQSIALARPNLPRKAVDQTRHGKSPASSSLFSLPNLNHIRGKNLIASGHVIRFAPTVPVRRHHQPEHLDIAYNLKRVVGHGHACTIPSNRETVLKELPSLRPTAPADCSIVVIGLKMLAIESSRDENKVQSELTLGTKDPALAGHPNSLLSLSELVQLMHAICAILLVLEIC
jgi:hypothetical protein